MIGKYTVTSCNPAHPISLDVTDSLGVQASLNLTVAEAEDIAAQLAQAAARSRQLAATLHVFVADEPRKCLRPLGCDCPACLTALGPIHPSNVGKDLRANPTGDISSPRA